MARVRDVQSWEPFRALGGKVRAELTSAATMVEGLRQICGLWGDSGKSRQIKVGEWLIVEGVWLMDGLGGLTGGTARGYARPTGGALRTATG
jgi:hypothetical protein